MNNLTTYGWTNQLFQLKQESNFNQLPHGRITVVHRTCYEVISEEGVFQCELTGNMLYGKLPSEYPCTGDWVLFQPIDIDRGLIVDRLPRHKTLYRRKSGTVSEKQAIAAYIDKAFIVQSFDAQFNVRRIERFMVQVREEGIIPVLILTKADLGFDKEQINEDLKHLSRQMQIFITSIHLPEKIEELRHSILHGETVVFTGMSGVGKSTLINALCGQEIFRTSDISESTGKGRHTSVRREMVLMENSGVLIDTPGVKLFGVTVDDSDLLSEVLDITDFEKSCRFMDCSHTNEPGCAVIQAVEEGQLDRSVYESYHKLKREAWHFSAAEHEKRKREKSFTKIVNEFKDYRKKR